MEPQLQVLPLKNKPRCFYLVLALIWGLIQISGALCLDELLVAGRSGAKNGVAVIGKSY